MRALALLPIAFTACAPSAYTPPARLLPLASPTGAPTGTDAQIDVGRLGQVFGPQLDVGGLRLRHAVTPTVLVEGETALMHVANAGSGGSRDAYTGRTGVVLRTPDPHAIRSALWCGVGGGYSPVAGRWGAVDLGVGVAGSHRLVRPLLALDAGVGVPLDERRFVVADTDGKARTLQLTRDATVRLALGVELGPPEATFVVGMSLMRIVSDDNGVVGAPPADGSDHMFASAGVGFRAAL